MRFAYADPPYLGCAVRLYGDHPDAAVYDREWEAGHISGSVMILNPHPDPAFRATAPGISEHT